MTHLTEVAVIGAGGYGREILEYANDARELGWPYRITGFVDDNPSARDGFEDVCPVIGSLDDIGSSPVRHFIVALGTAELRRRAATLVQGAGKSLVSLVHPRAYVSVSAQVGAGAVVCPFALIGARSTVDENVSINVYGSVGHDSTIGRNVVISPYVAITGNVTIGEGSFLGTHVTIAPGVSIGSHSKVVAGSTVHRNSADGSLLAGSPAKGRVMFKVPTSEEGSQR